MLKSAFTLALRELRSGLQGFTVLLACLILGVAAIAIVGALASAIERGIAEQGQPLLGGDIEVSMIHRAIKPEELKVLQNQATISKAATMRAMAVAPEARTLVEIKAVDRAYPLFGTIALEGGGNLHDKLTGGGSRWGAVAEPGLMSRLGLKVGDEIQLGNATIVINGLIAREPDRVGDGFILGPRLMLSHDALAATGLVQPGSLVRNRYRMKLNDAPDSGEVQEVAKTIGKQFPDAGWRVRTRDRAAPSVDRFIDRLTFFLTLVGLTALIVGGLGVANGVTAFIDRRMSNIATLKCLGASNRMVFAASFLQIMMIASVAIVIGVIAGGLAPLLAANLLSGVLPVPVSTGLEPLPLLQAAAFGYLVAIGFAVWPLARVSDIRPTALFRHAITGRKRWPGWPAASTIALAMAAMAALAFATFPVWRITAAYIAGLVISFIILAVLASVIMWLAGMRRWSNRAVARYAVANLHRPGAATPAIVLSLGLGLTLFVALALIDTNISRELRSSLPKAAPSFFFLDVPDSQRGEFMTLVKSQKGVKTVDAAPMLRGRVTRVRGKPVKELKVDPEAEWAFRGDRGLTYSARLPEGSELAEGEWWPEDYDGPPLVSMSSDIAYGAGLKIGETVTVNVLGREITAKIANLRHVDWRSLRINFVMVFSPNTLKGAPHMHLVTAGMEAEDEPPVLKAVSKAYPTVTAIRVKDALDAVNDLMGKLLAAVRGANVITLGVGILVLTGAIAGGLASRIYDAVVLKTFGASRSQLVAAFALEFALLGLATAIFAIIAGGLGAWAIITYIMDVPWAFSLPAAAITVAIALCLTVGGGLLTSWTALNARPARRLRIE